MSGEHPKTHRTALLCEELSVPKYPWVISPVLNLGSFQKTGETAVCASWTVGKDSLALIKALWNAWPLEGPSSVLRNS